MTAKALTSAEEMRAAEAVYAQMSSRFQTIREIELPYLEAMTDAVQAWWERDSSREARHAPSADDDRNGQFL